MLEGSQPRSLRACSRDDPECGARRGVPRWRLVTARLGRPGKSPARHYDLAARSSLCGSCVMRETEARPQRPKPPRWSAERRASRVISAFTRVLTRYGTQGASLGAWPAALRAGPTGVPLSTRTFLGAPPTPRFGVGEATMQTPGAEIAPRERWRLFVRETGMTNVPVDIVCPGCDAARAAAKRCIADPGPPQTAAVPGLQRTVTLRFTLRCARDTRQDQPAAVRNGRRRNLIVSDCYLQ
jgi:hypothetical protein